jgi:hypothetical protein
MLLRRLNQHIKNQNWFAVGLDLLIVVVGVYIGLQVQQWTNDREREQREAKYLERLHEEVVRTSELREENVARRIKTLNDLGAARDFLISEEGTDGLSPSTCLALVLVTVMTKVTADLPTVAELLSAGQLDTLGSADIRSSVVRLIQVTDRGNDALDGITRGVTPLYRRYPDLIQIRGSADRIDSDFEYWGPECNGAAMRENRSFLNDFVDFHLRYGAAVAIIKRESEELERLHLNLDQALGIEHPGEVEAP